MGTWQSDPGPRPVSMIFLIWSTSVLSILCAKTYKTFILNVLHVKIYGIACFQGLKLHTRTRMLRHVYVTQLYIFQLQAPDIWHLYFTPGMNQFTLLYAQNLHSYFDIYKFLYTILWFKILIVTIHILFLIHNSNIKLVMTFCIFYFQF